MSTFSGQVHLLAIPPGVDSVALGLATEPGRRLFWVLRNFGAYFTEDAAWDTWDLVIERDAVPEFEQAFGFSLYSSIWRSEINKLVSVLSVVSNNSPTSKGGGGLPLTAMAPPFIGAATVPIMPLPDISSKQSNYRSMFLLNGRRVTRW